MKYLVDANVLSEMCRFSNGAGLQDHGRYVERVAHLDPLSVVPPSVAVVYHSLNGRFQEALAPSRRVIELAEAMTPFRAGGAAGRGQGRAGPGRHGTRRKRERSVGAVPA